MPLHYNSYISLILLTVCKQNYFDFTQCIRYPVRLGCINMATPDH